MSKNNHKFTCAHVKISRWTFLSGIFCEFSPLIYAPFSEQISIIFKCFQLQQICRMNYSPNDTENMITPRSGKVYWNPQSKGRLICLKNKWHVMIWNSYKMDIFEGHSLTNLSRFIIIFIQVFHPRPNKIRKSLPMDQQRMHNWYGKFCRCADGYSPFIRWKYLI